MGNPIRDISLLWCVYSLWMVRVRVLVQRGLLARHVLFACTPNITSSGFYGICVISKETFRYSYLRQNVICPHSFLIFRDFCPRNEMSWVRIQFFVHRRSRRRISHDFCPSQRPFKHMVYERSAVGRMLILPLVAIGVLRWSLEAYKYYDQRCSVQLLDTRHFLFLAVHSSSRSHNAFCPFQSFSSFPTNQATNQSTNRPTCFNAYAVLTFESPP